jgi:4a-hydroxytetrahydrobiopterin dehydratase
MNSTDDTLENQQCVPCHGGVEPLSKAAAGKLLGKLDAGWKIVEDGKALRREFKFVDFYRTMSFVNAVAHVANGQDHHPDIECGWGYCRVRYQTHAIGGLHENDFICAAKIDALN